MSATRENYGDCNGKGCKAQPMSAKVQQTGDLYSPCENCPLIYAVRNDRTPFDQYWLQFYNSKAAATDYDLMNLQFAA